MQRDTRRHRVYNHSRVAATPLTSTMTVFFLLRCRIFFYRADSTSCLLSVSFLDGLDVTRRSSFAVPLFSQRGTTSSGARVHSRLAIYPFPSTFFPPSSANVAVSPYCTAPNVSTQDSPYAFHATDVCMEWTVCYFCSPTAVLNVASDACI